MTTLTRPVGVEELLAAHRSLMAGDFRRHGPRPRRLSRRLPRWDPVEPVLAVVGAAGGAGASTLALALATVAGGRVVECASVTASGLSAAPTAELGRRDGGWLQGTREAVLVERPALVLATCADVPVPTTATASTTLTVVDASWELGTVLATSSWVADLLHGSPVVVAATATIPGLRRLEAALAMLAAAGSRSRPVAAVLGPRRRKWGRPVEHSTGPLTTALLDAQRLLVVPTDARLGAAGLDCEPLPEALMDAANHLLHLTDVLPARKEPLP